ncbi:hypothetical protein CYMTET_16199 [Cymbomonas tetramitiformis]|uniref:Uncharacterized protein n=1 Tax=Cymbomonas tetramitiformis TaxID=36881 RepID=A0AAE0L8I3_9CHLO|nr:hypothetical protein CYMTET_16199 [Cymbomonas tetramitiformis]
MGDKTRICNSLKNQCPGINRVPLTLPPGEGIFMEEINCKEMALDCHQRQATKRTIYLHANTSRSRVCVFDIDETLLAHRHASDRCKSEVLGRAKSAVERCRELGYGLAINTAERGCEYAKRIRDWRGLLTNQNHLLKIGFELETLRSRATQYFSLEKACCTPSCDPRRFKERDCQVPLKELAMKNIANHFGVKPECLVLFDDKGFFGELKKSGYNFQQIGTRGGGRHECGGIGRGQLDRGLLKLGALC